MTISNADPAVPLAGDAVAEAIQRAVGKPSVPSTVAPYPVEQSTIGRWCDAVGDRNPVYSDAATARHHGFAGVIAPPAMIDAWNGVPFQVDPPAPVDQPTDAFGALMATLAAHGYTSVVATNCDQTYLDYLRLGDVVTCTEAIGDISPQKATSLGRGHFITVERRYSAGDGHAVASVSYRRFYFQPGNRREGGSSRMPAGEPNSAQMPLPPLSVPLTPSLITAGAIASGDFYPGHHDPDFARRAGLQDIIMNIRTTNGWISRYATDWAGPAARVQRISVGLGTPNYPYDTMDLSGAVRVSEQRQDGQHVRLAIAVRNAIGTHATAEVDLMLPHA